MPSLPRPFTVLPAVDVAAGRLARGVADLDVVAYAASLQAQGASWLHVADLDAARGVGDNSSVVGQVVQRVQIPVQWSGGVRTAQQVQQALLAGAARVNLAADTLADRVMLQQILTRWGERVCVALDVLHDQVCPRGTGGDPIADLDEAVSWLAWAGCRCLVVTDVHTDGTLTGPNVALMRHVCAALAPTEIQVYASGGVASLDDLRALSTTPVCGVVLGSALLAGRFTLREALSAVSG